MPDTQNKLAEHGERIASLEARTNGQDEAIKSSNEKFKNYVTSHEFAPVKLIVYGLAAVSMGAVLTKLVQLVVR